MKTNGQLLYEYKHPSTVRVYAAADAFRTQPLQMEQHQVAWKFLTAASRESWERSAVGHHLFQEYLDAKVPQ
jgi:hypothetical protein